MLGPPDAETDLSAERPSAYQHHTFGVPCAAGVVGGGHDRQRLGRSAGEGHHLQFAAGKKSNGLAIRRPER